ncbi:MAG: carboxypeptidase-like regulatory domain-containing protein [Chloroflexota bacterium]
MTRLAMTRRLILMAGLSAGIRLSLARAVAQMMPVLEVSVNDGIQPLGGVIVQLKSALLEEGDMSAVTSSSGRVHFDLPSPGLYDVVAEADGFSTGLVSDVQVRDDGVSQVTLVLARRVPGSGAY